MSIVYGNFEGMAACFVNRLTEDGEKCHVLFDDVEGEGYGVCDLPELAELHTKRGLRKVRPVCCMNASEFLGLIFIRYREMVTEVQNGIKAESVQAGQQSGAEHTGLDVAGNRTEKGVGGSDNGGGAEKDSGETVH